MCIDGWWQSSGVQPQFDRRRHDLSDAFALFGPWSKPNALSNYSTSSVQLISDDQSQVMDFGDTGTTLTSPKVTISPTIEGVFIEGDSTISGNLHVSSGASGAFTSQDGQVITVQEGIIVSIQ
jgi:hypothetical protein